MPTWKPVYGYEDFYEVSDIGEVRRILGRVGQRICRPCRPGSCRGYTRFVLCVDNQKRTFSGHKLVWEAFCGPIPQGLQINHRNGKKADNSISNLELCTPSENTRHAYQVLGLKGRCNPNPGSRNGRAKLKDQDIPEIKRLHREGLAQQKIADRFGVCQTSISRILIGKGWLTY
jgi:hypothetical protein